MKNVSAISPVNMAEENGFMSRKLLYLANDLHCLKFIASSMVDNAKFQYDEFIKNEVSKIETNFLSLI